MQVSIFPNILVSSDVLLNLKDGKHYTMYLRKTAFQSISELVLRNPRKTRMPSQEERVERKRGKLTHVERTYLESHTEKRFTQALLEPMMHEE